jgi:hypothetical protein
MAGRSTFRRRTGPRCFVREASISSPTSARARRAPPARRHLRHRAVGHRLQRVGGVPGLRQRDLRDGPRRHRHLYRHLPSGSVCERKRLCGVRGGRLCAQRQRERVPAVRGGPVWHGHGHGVKRRVRQLRRRVLRPGLGSGI